MNGLVDIDNLNIGKLLFNLNHFWKTGKVSFDQFIIDLIIKRHR